MKEILASLSNGEEEACRHPAFIKKNLCAVCKKSVNYNIPTTLPFGYLFRDLSLTVDAIRHLRDLDFQKLLLRERLHLVLDLDNTLIHGIENKNNNNVKKKKKSNKKSSSSLSSSSATSNDDVYKILQGKFSVKLRPGVGDFLQNATELFDLSIYTMAEESYAKKIAKILESDSFRFSSVISKEYSAKENGKSLNIVLSHEQVTLIVDDLADIWATEDQRNVIKIKPYLFFEKGVAPPWDNDDDQELARVWSILKNVHTRFFDQNNQNKVAQRDVRQLLRIN